MWYLAIFVAAVASWLLGALWYGLLGKAWLAALGKTRAELTGPSGKPSPVPFVLSFLAELVMAFVLAGLLPRLGQVTVGSGLMAGLTMWVGFVITALGVNHAYSGARPSLTAIDGGHWLAVLLVQGAVLAAVGA